MYINLRIFTPLAVKPDLALNTPWKTLRGDLDLKSLKIIHSFRFTYQSSKKYCSFFFSGLRNENITIKRVAVGLESEILHGKY